MRRIAMLLAAACVLAPAAARAATQAPFDQATFAADQAAGKPVVVFIEASWCPTCAKERPILAQLMTDPAFKDLVILDVDFDSQKDVVRQMRATMQSTLVAFHGRDERGRTVGETHPEALRALLQKAEG
jgi:thiol-disulfide isomerase/thioredoxin